jgi:enamine deaminase RidA (YjgF/YER057c/UK114 family)
MPGVAAGLAVLAGVAATDALCAQRARSAVAQLRGFTGFSSYNDFCRGGSVDRSDVNPWEWSKQFGFSQAVDLRQPQRLLFCSGQTAIQADGSPPAVDDMDEQVRTAFRNLGQVLSAAGYSAADVVRINYYTTDVDALLPVLHSGAHEFFGDNLPASTLLGVSRLAYPQLKIEIEAVAAG